MVDQFIKDWASHPDIAPNIVSWRIFPERPAQTEPFPAELHYRLHDVLNRQGIRQLYSHQTRTWYAIKDGLNPVIVTGTASGKTLAYNLPILDHLLRAPTGRALYLFPTKALAHDQAKNLSILCQKVCCDDRSRLPKIMPGTYDGDTPSAKRSSIRQQAQIVITNPDMLHTGILPHHTRWAMFFSSLSYVVIDEVHTYRGVFGSHVANIIRRLKRVAAFYNTTLQFIMTSATIANPVELAETLSEESVTLIDKDGSAKGPRHFIIYNPPLVNFELGVRRSAMLESVAIGQALIDRNIQTILFGRSRRTVELMVNYLRDFLRKKGSKKVEIEQTVRAYRSGYLPQQRREIEKGLREGTIKAIIATTALELGIDIGGMGATVLMGYPGTIAATWQQAGRSGRGREASLTVLVASANPLDQFLVKHPEYLFDQTPERALINPDHLVILWQHIRCAAFELPFVEDDRFGQMDVNVLKEYLDFLVEGGHLHYSGQKYFWMTNQYPAEAVSLRSASIDAVVLQVADRGQVTAIGQVDLHSAYWMVHPQAIYLHEGQTFIVRDLNLEAGLATIAPVETEYYTEAVQESNVTLVNRNCTESVHGGAIFFGDIEVTRRVVGFKKIKWYTHEQLGYGELALPSTHLQTTGYWITLSAETVVALREQGLWSNDPNDYGPNWPTQRQLARQRDGFRCQMCGAPETGRGHDVHHIQPFRTFLSDREANRLENLVTLCPRCHHRAETVVRMTSGLAGLGYILGHLAPLFLMCDRGDLGVHTDPQAILGNGQPTIVIFDLVPAGIGLSQRLYEIHPKLIAHAYEIVGSCTCVEGCPSCVGPAGENGLSGKAEAQAILRLLIAEK